MRGARIVDACKVETWDYPDPQPEGEEVVVKIEAGAICGSDLHALYEKPGGLDFIPGHEAAGVVVAVDRPRVLKLGDRVCTAGGYTCGVCQMCRLGYFAYCTGSKGGYGFGLNGVHAEYARVCERALLRMPDWLSFEQGCLILDPVGTTYHAHKRIGTNATHVVGIFGLGPMGLGTLCVAKHLGARVIGVEPVAYRRELAKKLGADVVLDPTEGRVVERLRELTDGLGLDRVLECSGEAEPLHFALDVVRPFGHVAIIGENTEATIRPSGHFLRKEITMSGSTCFPLGEYDELLRAYRSGLRSAEMITHRFTVDQASEAYETFHGRQTGKVIFVPIEK